MSTDVVGGEKEAPPLGKLKKISECEEEAEGSQAISFTCRGIDQQLIRQVVPVVIN